MNRFVADDAAHPTVRAPQDLPPFERLVTALAELVFEARRRDDAHFDRVALTLPLVTDGARRELVRTIAEAAGVAVREATIALPMDAVGELMRLELDRACECDLPGCDAELVARVDWQAHVRQIVEPMRMVHDAFQAPCFDALPGLAHLAAADRRTRYLRCGEGAEALLLVNAFGLPMDVWHELACRLSPSLRLLALDSGGHGASDDPYYGVPDAPARFVDAVLAMLAAEGLEACHVACWCSGSKFALELARRCPAVVSSLALLAPSFAGEPCADEEGDSAFEASLSTMCQVVDRLPASAPGMARSMQAMLSRSVLASPGGDADSTGAAVFALHDRVTTPWVYAPFEDAARMVAYSRQLLSFRAHHVVPAGCLSMPLMLVTGEQDATTNNRRAHTLLAGCGPLAHFELQRAGHYFPHQNADLVASLLLDFLRDGMRTESPHPRLRRVAEELVSGEL